MNFRAHGYAGGMEIWNKNMKPSCSNGKAFCVSEERIPSHALKGEYLF